MIRLMLLHTSTQRRVYQIRTTCTFASVETSERTGIDVVGVKRGPCEVERWFLMLFKVRDTLGKTMFSN
jgi:hypothetical protein